MNIIALTFIGLTGIHSLTNLSPNRKGLYGESLFMYVEPT